MGASGVDDGVELSFSVVSGELRLRGLGACSEGTSREQVQASCGAVGWMVRSVVAGVYDGLRGRGVPGIEVEGDVGSLRSIVWNELVDGGFAIVPEFARGGCSVSQVGDARGERSLLSGGSDGVGSDSDHPRAVVSGVEAVAPGVVCGGASGLGPCGAGGCAGCVGARVVAVSSGVGIGIQSGGGGGAPGSRVSEEEVSSRTLANRRKREKKKERKLRRQGLDGRVPEWRKTAKPLSAKGVELERGGSGAPLVGTIGSVKKSCVGLGASALCDPRGGERDRSFFSGLSCDVREQLKESRAKMLIAQNKRRAREEEEKLESLKSPVAAVERAMRAVVAAEKAAAKAKDSKVAGWASAVITSYAETVAKSVESSEGSYESFIWSAASGGTAATSGGVSAREAEYKAKLAALREAYEAMPAYYPEDLSRDIGELRDEYADVNYPFNIAIQKFKSAGVWAFLASEELDVADQARLMELYERQCAKEDEELDAEIGLSL